MISRFHTALFTVLLVASVVMGGLLWRQLDRAHQRLLQGEDSAPTQAPQVAPAEQATLLVANDADNSLLTQVETLPLPQDLYAAPDAAHPVPGGATSIAQVFLLPASALPGDPKLNESRPASAAASATGPLLAVVNFTGAFAASHPSGLETENLTLQSISGTLHANLPRVTEVRFLVDGQARATLAGHADLTGTYLAADAAPTEGTHP
jgi:hypothetical protein